MTLHLTGCGEANVPPKFLLNFIKLGRRQLVPIILVNKIAFGILLQVISKNVVLARRRVQNQTVFTRVGGQDGSLKRGMR